jgi:hypothetical protein
MSEAAERVGRVATLQGLVAIGVGWLLGLVAYDQLIGFMLERGWLEQTEALTPTPFHPVLLVVGIVFGVWVSVADARAGRSPTWSVGLSRFLAAAGISLAGLGLFHAHAVGQLVVLGPDQVFLKDVLYHGPGIALIVVGRYSRPVSRRGAR